MCSVAISGGEIWRPALQSEGGFTRLGGPAVFRINVHRMEGSG
jgi:hypothetical protein